LLLQLQALTPSLLFAATEYNPRRPCVQAPQEQCPCRPSL
jgi:hypothetical protein